MGVTDRIIQIGGQISGNPTAGGREKILQKNPDDVSFQDTKSYFMR
jgi:acetyl-CoA acyltransferase 1